MMVLFFLSMEFFFFLKLDLDLDKQLHLKKNIGASLSRARRCWEPPCGNRESPRRT